MKRYGMVIKVRPEKLEEYKRLHAQVWPAVLKMIGECNIRNYSIYHKDGYLFSYFEYHGGDFGVPDQNQNTRVCSGRRQVTGLRGC